MLSHLSSGEQTYGWIVFGMSLIPLVVAMAVHSVVTFRKWAAR